MHRGQGGARPTDLDGLLEAGDRVGDAALLVLREEISSLGCLCLHHRHLGSKRIQGSTGCLGRLALWLQPLLEEGREATATRQRLGRAAYTPEACLHRCALAFPWISRTALSSLDLFALNPDMNAVMFSRGSACQARFGPSFASTSRPYHRAIGWDAGYECTPGPSSRPRAFASRPAAPG